MKQLKTKITIKLQDHQRNYPDMELYDLFDGNFLVLMYIYILEQEARS